jgi:hypothetical protein
MNVTLSCGCERYFSPPPLPGDRLWCPRHDAMSEPVMPGITTKCEDCDWIKKYSDLAQLTACTTSTAHAVRYNHKVSHNYGFDSSDRMCLHDHRKVPVFTIGKPPF